MAVNWYPGHMRKARKQIKERMEQIELVLEVLDARIPFSSENPLVKELRDNRPCITLLNKSDLADPAVTKQWLDYFNAQENVTAIAATTEQKGQLKKLPDLCRKLLPNRKHSEIPIHIMIMGIPNVGKSTIINVLAGKMIAKTGDEAAVTRNLQRVRLMDNGVVLSDSPGMLWPKMHNNNCGYRLAVTGAVKSTAIDYEDVALFAAESLLALYPQLLIERYKLKELPKDDIGVLEAIGRKRSCLRPGGVVDLHKASEIFLNEVRQGIVGRISLENPQTAFLADDESGPGGE